MQRGMPSASCLQFSGCCWTLPAQQVSVALHENAARRQMLPAGLHALPLSHRPTVAPAALEHVTFAACPPGPPLFEPGEPRAPQQSAFCMQMLPVTRQPDSGWQTSTPVGA